jgi:hypothetical protein
LPHGRRQFSPSAALRSTPAFGRAVSHSSRAAMNGPPAWYTTYMAYLLVDTLTLAQRGFGAGYKDSAATFQSWAQVIALASAAVFFAMKAFQGWFSIDLQIDLQLKRRPAPGDTQDYLAVSATIRRGPQGTLRMHDAVARFTYGDRTEDQRVEVNRFSSMQTGRLTTIDLSRSDIVPTLNFAPGDVTCLSTYAKVDRLEPCRVDVVFMGYKFGSRRRAQWRASAISLPLGRNDDPKMTG